MPRSSNGIYTQPANTTAVSGQTISSVAFNTLETDIGNELTNSLDRLGRGTMEANLPMGGNLINNLGTPVATTDAATKGYVDTTALPNTANSITNALLAQAPTNTVKGTVLGAVVATSTVTISDASPGVVTWAANGQTDGTPIIFTTTGTLPTGLSPNTVYYILAPATNTFTVAATVDGTAINTSSAGSGTHTASTYAMVNETDLTFSYVGQQVASGIPLTPLIVNLKIANDGATPDTKIDVTADFAVISGSSGMGRHSSISVVINATTTGANALDTGALAATTWYYVYLISTGSTVAGLVSLSATAPALPATYLYFLRVGAFQTDGSTKFYRMLQRGNKMRYVATAGTNTLGMWLLANTATGNVSTPTWTAFQVTGNGKAAPPTAPLVTVSLTNATGSGYGQAIAAPNNSYSAYNAAGVSVFNVPPIGLSGNESKVMGDIVLESNSIYAASQNAANTYGTAIWIPGYEDAVPAC